MLCAGAAPAGEARIAASRTAQPSASSMATVCVTEPNRSALVASAGRARAASAKYALSPQTGSSVVATAHAPWTGSAPAPPRSPAQRARNACATSRVQGMDTASMVRTHARALRDMKGQTVRKKCVQRLLSGTAAGMASATRSTFVFAQRGGLGTFAGNRTASWTAVTTAHAIGMIVGAASVKWAGVGMLARPRHAHLTVYRRVCAGYAGVALASASLDTAARGVKSALP